MSLKSVERKKKKLLLEHYAESDRDAKCESVVMFTSCILNKLEIREARTITPFFFFLQKSVTKVGNFFWDTDLYKLK